MPSLILAWAVGVPPLHRFRLQYFVDTSVHVCGRCSLPSVSRWRHYLPCAKRFSPCSAGFLLSSLSPLLALWISSQRSQPRASFGEKSSPARISSHLLNPALSSVLLLCVICMRNCSWFTATNSVNIRRISSSWIKHDSAPCCLKTRNAPWHHVHDVRADAKRYIYSKKYGAWPILQLAKTTLATSASRDEIINSFQDKNSSKEL